MKDNQPLVSICCITYNHEKYIRDAIDGFLMQETTFPIEIIIHDDASTDKTQNIIKQYANKNPELFVTILQRENQYSLGIKPFSKYILPKVRGKYIAFCEGDDYWIEPYKLQKQVDYLEANSNTSLVFSDRIFERGQRKKLYRYKKKCYTTFDVLSSFIPGLQNICFRTSCLDFDSTQKYNRSINGDRLIPYLCSLKGQIVCIDGVFSVYRETGEGISSSTPKELIFRTSMLDIFQFHKTLSFPSRQAFIKAQVRYIVPFIKNYIANPRFMRKELRNSFAIFGKLTILDYMLYFYYICVWSLVLTLQRFKILKYAWY